MERPERVSFLPAELPASACILGDASPQIWCDSAAGRLRRGLARAGVTGFATEGELAVMVPAVLVLRADAAIDGTMLQALDRTSVGSGKRWAGGGDIGGQSYNRKTQI